MPSKALYVVYPHKEHLPYKVRLFLDFIKEKLKHKAQYWDSLAK